MGKNKRKKITLYLIIAVLLCGLFAGWYYAFYPPINIHSMNFWTNLIIWMCIVFGVYMLVDIYVFATNDASQVIGGKKVRRKGRKGLNLSGLFKSYPIETICGIVIFLSVLFCIFGNLIGAPILRAKSYASLINVEYREFNDDIKASEKISDIALMDTNSARILGERKLGSLSELVSQYEVSESYTQINIKDTPKKVATLDYASFFKWYNNKSQGIPGYIMVDPVDFTSKYVELNKGMKYVPSGYFNENLKRHVQFKYPTKMIYDYYFEVDDEGNPWYVCPCVTYKIGLFGGKDIKGAILCDPISGDCRYYDTKDVPKWIDRVYDGKILEAKYNWFGSFQKGFINSIIGQSGCVQTTDEYGYKTIEDDVWIGDRAIILSGVKIGRGAVIGAGCVVTKDVNPYEIVIGNPMRVLRKRFPDNIIDKLMNVDFSKLDSNFIHSHIDLLYEELNDENIHSFIDLN